MIIAPSLSDSTNQITLRKFPGCDDTFKENKPERIEREAIGDMDSPDERPVSSSIDESSYGISSRESVSEWQMVIQNGIGN